MTEMTVVEAYIKFSGQLIILVSGLPGCNKSKISKKIAELFKIQHLNLRQFIKEDYNDVVELSNGSKVIDWDNENAYDWDKFNSKIEEVKSSGVIISGVVFPSDNIKFKVDNHLNIKISKQKYITCRHEFLTKNKETKKDLFELIDSSTESLTINKLIYPHYLEYTQRSAISKFLNGNDANSEELFNEAFDHLIEDVQQYLKRQNKRVSVHRSRENKKTPMRTQMRNQSDNDFKDYNDYDGEGYKDYYEDNNIDSKKSKKNNKELEQMTHNFTYDSSYSESHEESENETDDDSDSDSSDNSNIIDINKSSSSSEPYVLATVDPNDETLRSIQ